MTITYRHMLLLGAIFMVAVGVMSVMQGAWSTEPIVVLFEALASALLLFWALA